VSINKEANVRRSVKILCVLGLAALIAAPLMARAVAEQRPISDFLAVQLNTVESWCTQADVSPSRCVAFDAFGKRAEYFGFDLGTSFAGNVKVRELPDGTAHVSVLLRTTNALCWGGQWDDSLGRYVDAFGYNGTLVSEGNPPSLGDGLTKLEFTMPSPDAPLPNYRQLMYIGDPDYPLLSASAEISCKGVLRSGSGYPDGTPGAAHIAQVFLLQQWYKQELCPAGDCWPAEVVNFRATGAR
jgi:hypothetical protein